MRKLLSNALANYIVRFGTQLITFFLIPVISNKVTETELSLYLIGLSFMALSIVIFDYSTQIIAVKNIARSVFAIRRYIITIYAVRLFFVFIFLSIFTLLLLFNGNLSIWLIGVIACLQGLKPVWFYQARLNLKYSITVELIFKFLTLCCLKLNDELTVEYVYLVIAISEFFTLIVQFYPIRKFIFLRKSINEIKNILLHLKNGINPFLSRIYGAIYISLPLPIGSIWFGSDLLFYTLCLDRVVRIINSLTSPFFMALYPYLSQNNKFNKSKIYMITVLLSLILYLVIYTFNDFILSEVFNTKYQSDFSNVLFLIPSLTILSAIISMLEYNLKDKYNKLMEYMKYSFLSSIILMVFAIVLNEKNLLVCSIIMPEICLLTLLLSNLYRSRNEV